MDNNLELTEAIIGTGNLVTNILREIDHETLVNLLGIAAAGALGICVLCQVLSQAKNIVPGEVVTNALPGALQEPLTSVA